MSTLYHNDYVEELGPLYHEIPKAVLAAVAVSLAAQMEHAEARRGVGRLLCEWDSLHENGIVPQYPKSMLLRAVIAGHRMWKKQQEKPAKISPKGRERSPRARLSVDGVARKASAQAIDIIEQVLPTGEKRAGAFSRVAFHMLGAVLHGLLEVGGPEAARKMLEEFLVNVSHGLTTPRHRVSISLGWREIEAKQEKPPKA